MKVCVTGLRGIPGVMGGVETHCQELLPRLKQIRGNNEYIVLARTPYVASSAYEYAKVKVVPLPCWRNKYLEAASNTLVAVLYARFIAKPDLLHIHAIGPALFAPIARLLGLRLVVTHHGQDYDRSKWNRFAKWCLRAGERCAVLNAHRLIAVSQSLAAELKRRYPEHAAKIDYIPNGFSLQAGNAEGSWDFAKPFGIEKGRYILAVGRLVPEKGFHELIAAFRRASRPDLKLVFAGKADHEDEYSRQLLKNASRDIVFLGFQGPDVLQQLYAHASLFVLPSHLEGLPIAALDAACLGIPVVLSDIVPNLELGLPAANYFPTGNIEALAAKLAATHEEFRTDPRSISGRFDWDAIARATADVYAAAA